MPQSLFSEKLTSTHTSHARKSTWYTKAKHTSHLSSSGISYSHLPSLTSAFRCASTHTRSVRTEDTPAGHRHNQGGSGGLPSVLRAITLLCTFNSAWKEKHSPCGMQFLKALDHTHLCQVRKTAEKRKITVSPSFMIQATDLYLQFAIPLNWAVPWEKASTCTPYPSFSACKKTR